MIKQTALVLTALGLNASAYSSPNFTFNYNLWLESSDQGNQKVSGMDDPQRKTSFNNNSYLEISGEKEGVSYLVYANLDGGTLGDALEVALATKKLSESVSLSAGVNYTNSGGYDNGNSDYNVHFVNHYSSEFVYGGGVAKLLQLDYSLGDHGFSLQLAEDVVAAELDENSQCTETARNCGRYNSVANQPAVLLQYNGKLANHFEPLIQIVSYDGGHSMETTLGLQFAFGKVGGYLDFIQNSIAYKSGTEELKDTVTAMTFELRYDFANYVPKLKYTSFDIKQDGTDLSVNSDRSSYDDNVNGILLGLEVKRWGDQFIPYIDLVSKSQVVSENNSDTTVTELSVIAGVMGSL